MANAIRPSPEKFYAPSPAVRRRRGCFFVVPKRGEVQKRNEVAPDRLPESTLTAAEASEEEENSANE